MDNLGRRQRATTIAKAHCEPEMTQHIPGHQRDHVVLNYKCSCAPTAHRGRGLVTMEVLCLADLDVWEPRVSTHPG